MSAPATFHTPRTLELRSRLDKLQAERAELRELRKHAFLAAPPMPQGQTPPMDPSSRQPMMAPAAPMDPAMMVQQEAPVDPATLSAPSAAPAMNPDILEEILGTLESIAPVISQMQQKIVEQEEHLQDLSEQVMQLEARLAAQPDHKEAPARGGAW